MPKRVSTEKILVGAGETEKINKDGLVRELGSSQQFEGELSRLLDSLWCTKTTRLCGWHVKNRSGRPSAVLAQASRAVADRACFLSHV